MEGGFPGIRTLIKKNNSPENSPYSRHDLHNTSSAKMATPVFPCSSVATHLYVPLSRKFTLANCNVAPTTAKSGSSSFAHSTDLITLAAESQRTDKSVDLITLIIGGAPAPSSNLIFSVSFSVIPARDKKKICEKNISFKQGTF